MDPAFLEDLRVAPLDDGRMGGLKLIPHGALDNRKFGREAAAVEFDDVDGVKVIATLYVDQQGWPLELDMWKTDFSPLQEIPEGCL
jgi:hypothetical protein